MQSKSHFDLLRNEHLELQSKYADLKSKYELLAADSTLGGGNESSFVVQLMKTVKNLYEKELFSDITIYVDGHELKSHRFLIFTRTSYWEDIATRKKIEIPDVKFNIFYLIYRWMYTDSLDYKCCDENDLMEMCQIAIRYRLLGLQKRCIELLTAQIDVSNCISIYELADRENLISLRDKCASVVATRWTEFDPQHFARLSAPTLHRLLKSNSMNLLHSIIQLNREDVLFLYFIENDLQLNSMINQADEKNITPLELALTLSHTNIALQLMQHNADCNVKDEIGQSILARMVLMGNVFASGFLVSNGADLRFVHNSTGKGLLHYLAESTENKKVMADWVESCLPLIDVNAKDKQGRTALILSILLNNIYLTEVLLRYGVDVIAEDDMQNTALSVALFLKNDLILAEKLTQLGGTVAVNHSINGETLLHMSLQLDKDDVLRFLIENKVSINETNKQGCTPLHCAVQQNNVQAVNHLLNAGASSNQIDNQGNSPLHLAIMKGRYMTELFAKSATDVDWCLADRNGRSALRLALEGHFLDSAHVLISAGSPVDEEDQRGNSLLVQCLLLGDDEGAVFLLDRGAQHWKKDSSGRSCLELAASHGLTSSVRALCGNGINLNKRTDEGKGYTVLEKAVSEGHWECALLLVSLGCDMESYTTVNGCEQTLLHYMMDMGNQPAAVFLIENGCNVNAMKRYVDSVHDDGQSPIHLAVSWGLLDVACALMKAGADLSVQDFDGRTACHIAVRERDSEALSLLLSSPDVSFLSTRDKLGQTPLSLAIAIRDHKAAAAIVSRQPHTALQANGHGENLLHVAVKANDLESVLFVLGTHTDPTRSTNDTTRRTALHISATVDDEMILRNLLLAGCHVNARSGDGSTALHEAVRTNRPNLVQILLENGANGNIVDDRGDNALLTAVRNGSIDCVRMLLSMNAVETRAVNKSNQSALHLCAIMLTDKMPKGTPPADMCEILLNAEEKKLSEKDLGTYIDCRDINGNTALLLAYMNGNAAVCRSLLKRGATMGARNIDGATVFNFETPTKQLLFRLLDWLEREPRWSDGDSCDCGIRFSITQRKHHCRHCGRLVCAKCSEITMPIAKFGEEKRVRVCILCAEVLTTGGSR